MTQMTHTANTLHGLTGQFAALRAAAGQRISLLRRYRATLTELNSLSDLELVDLGLSRGELRGIAWTASVKEIALGH